MTQGLTAILLWPGSNQNSGMQVMRFTSINFNTRDYAIYYANLLEGYNDDLKEKWLHLYKRQVIFHCALLNNLDNKLLPHPQFFPDSPPSDYFMFLNMSKRLGGKGFGSNTLFEKGKQIGRHWTNCLMLQGHYVEEYNLFTVEKLVFHGKVTNLLTGPRISLGNFY